MSRMGDEPESAVPEERRCAHIHADGRRCKQRRWSEQLCYHHDPAAAERRKKKGARVSALRVLTATEVQELLAGTLEDLRCGRIGAGQGYAVGYLAQLLLTNLVIFSLCIP